MICNIYVGERPRRGIPFDMMICMDFIAYVPKANGAYEVVKNRYNGEVGNKSRNQVETLVNNLNTPVDYLKDLDEFEDWGK